MRSGIIYSRIFRLVNKRCTVNLKYVTPEKGYRFLDRHLFPLGSRFLGWYTWKRYIFIWNNTFFLFFVMLDKNNKISLVSFITVHCQVNMFWNVCSMSPKFIGLPNAKIAKLLKKSSNLLYLASFTLDVLIFRICLNRTIVDPKK